MAWLVACQNETSRRPSADRDEPFPHNLFDELADRVQFEYGRDLRATDFIDPTPKKKAVE